MEKMSAKKNKLPQVGRSMSSESHGTDSSASMALDSGGPNLQISFNTMRGGSDNVRTPVECETLSRTTGLRSGAHTEHDGPVITIEGGTPVESTPSNTLSNEANSNTVSGMDVDPSTSTTSSDQPPTDLRRVASTLGRTHLTARRTGAERRRAAKAAGTWIPRGQKKKERLARTLEQSGLSTLPTLRAKAAEGAGTPDKRARSEVSTPSSADTAADGKKQKLTYSEAAMFKMAVILEGFPEKKFSDTDADTLGSLLSDMIRPLDDGVGPQMKNWRYEGGAVLLTCVTSSTKTWLEDSVRTIGTLNESKLVVGEASKILKTVKVITRFPSYCNAKEVGAVLKMLDVQNPGIRTADWRILNTKVEPKGKTVVLQLPEEEVELLRQKGFALFCSMEQIHFSILANIQHKKLATANLTQKFKQGDLDVVLIQEPWCVNGKVCGLNDTGGTLVYHKGSSENPRTCLLINKKHNFLLLQEHTSRDLVAVKLQYISGGSRLETVIGSAYFPGNDTHPPPPVEVDALIQRVVSRGGAHLILGCDANAHHTVWNSTDTNTRGESLLEYIVGNNLTILNQGSRPTFITAVRKEILDLTLCTQHIANSIKGWKVLKETSMADHQYIYFEIEGRCVEQISYRDPKRTNWDHFRRDLKRKLGPVQTKLADKEDIDATAVKLQDCIMKAYESNNTPIVKTSNGKTKWWNNNLALMRTKVRKLFRRARKYGNDWAEYKRSLTRYNAEVRRAKTLSWRAFCGSIENTKEISRLQKVMKTTPMNPIGTLINSHGEYTQTGLETLNTLIECHFPGAENYSSMNTLGTVLRKPCRSDWEFVRRLVKSEAIKSALKTFGPLKSPGADGIYPCLLQEAADIITPHLVYLYRASVVTGYVPKTWGISRVVFIPKPGKSDYGQPKSFRPICLNSFILKTLEKLIDGHIKVEIRTRGLINETQFAYQSGRSTESALHKVVNQIEDSLENKEIALSAFLDIEGAFDNTSYNSIIRAASSKGINSNLTRWIEAMLRGRIIKANLFNETVEVRATRGCPQGGVLSPILWTLVVDSLLSELNGSRFYSIGYADDVVIIIVGKYFEILLDLMQQALRIVENWCKNEGLKVNPTKTTVVPFTRKILRNNKKLKLFGKEIEMSEEVKYLGVTLDRKLTWNRHLEKTINKATICMNTCRRAVGKTWGLKPKMVYWLYTMVVRPTITYGALVWWPKTEQATVIKKLRSLQRQACIGITGTMKTTPTLALETILNLPPLELFIKGVARMASYRMECNNTWKPKRPNLGHVRINTVIHNRILQMISDQMVTCNYDVTPAKTVINSRDYWERNHVETKHGEIVWYTDGSKTTDGTGAGIHGANPRVDISISLGEHGTVFQAEVYAILGSLQKSLEIGYSNSTIKIFSDSQAAIKALENNQTKSKLVWECKHLLKRLAERNRVKITWIPGHAGFEGNEKADELARAGSSTKMIGPEPAIGIPKCLAKMVVQDWIKKEHIRIWNTETEMRFSRRMIKEPSKRISKETMNLNRGDMRRIVGMLTGHCYLRKHLNTIGVYHGTTRCRRCGEEEESASHIIFDCPALSLLRLSTLGHPGEEIVTIHSNPIKPLLSFARGSGVFEMGESQ
ncbi:hypothetical protein M8J77_015582 [Diaphorina citri]|nr:hypothetical protein M8J77_015582 [Diaphorina citri]